MKARLENLLIALAVVAIMAVIATDPAVWDWVLLHFLED